MHGAVLHRAALWKANVTVVVVDEASQVSEQELIAALPPSAQHLIMIGLWRIIQHELIAAFHCSIIAIDVHQNSGASL